LAVLRSTSSLSSSTYTWSSLIIFLISISWTILFYSASSFSATFNAYYACKHFSPAFLFSSLRFFTSKSVI
jgi:hypothetical protein